MSKQAYALVHRDRRTTSIGGVLIIVALIAGAFWTVQRISAVHDTGLFELEGNAVEESARAGIDWSTVYAAPGNKPAGAVDGVFVNDGDSPADRTYFDQGGSKDVYDIDDGPWLWSTGDVAPDKDEILSAYAVGFLDGTDLIAYFGADRYANNGDAHLGFWFFQDNVGRTNPTGTSGGFTGEHVDGDVLVLSEFTGGGGTTTIRVFAWRENCATNVNTMDPAHCVETNLEELFGPAGTGVGDCTVVANNDVACATVNDDSNNGKFITSPWPYRAKAGKFSANQIPSGSFYEGGINLTAFLGGNTGCFSSFMAETRSSSSPSAQLKDFALGQFSLCALTIDKEASTDISKVGDDIDYTFTVTNGGGITLFLDSIEDTVLGTLASSTGQSPNTGASQVSSTCGASLNAGDSCTIVIRYTVQSGDPDPLDNTVTANYNTASDLTGADVEAADSDSVDLFQPAVEVTKSGPDSASVGETVTYTYTIYDRSSADAPDLLLDGTSGVIDDKVGNLTTAATAAGCDRLTVPDGNDASGTDQCTFTATYEVQPGDVPSLTNTVNVLYHPDGFPNNITDDASHMLDVFNPDVTIAKTGNGTIDEGTRAVFTVTVTNEGVGTAFNVQVSDNLPAGAGLDWSIDSQGGTACAITGALGSEVLSCNIGTMLDGATYEVIVSSATDSAECGEIPNTATVSADNDADPTNNSADDTVTLRCGALRIIKTAKHFDQSGNTMEDLVATFTVVDNEGTSHEVTTDADGLSCIDGLALSLTQSITETGIPAGYAAPDIANVEITAGDCTDSPYTGSSIGVENVPLTDLLVHVESQKEGATASSIVCSVEGGDEIGNTNGLVDSAELDVDNLEPGTYVCTIVIDP